MERRVEEAEAREAVATQRAEAAESAVDAMEHEAEAFDTNVIHALERYASVMVDPAVDARDLEKGAHDTCTDAARVDVPTAEPQSAVAPAPKRRHREIPPVGRQRQSE